ncbi:MAG: hypothetical protein MZV65_37885 [Chromatiales bacterium]|nr:hypothetical protein [Chromatiales bacterium]
MIGFAAQEVLAQLHAGVVLARACRRRRLMPVLIGVATGLILLLGFAAAAADRA